MREKSRKRQTALAVFLIFLLLFTLKNAACAANGIKKGLVLFGNMLLPSLLPFLVLSELFLASGTGAMLGRMLARPLKLFFGLTEKGATALLLGALCGVPIGIISAVQLHTSGEIGDAELGRLVLLANTPSIGFLISAVGIAAFGSQEIGVLLLLATLLATLLTGVFLKLTEGDLSAPRHAASNSEKPCSLPLLLTGAVKSSVTALLGVCGFVLLFSAISECIKKLLCDAALPQSVTALLSGVLELTAGINAATALGDPHLSLVLAAFFSGFSGLSIALQIFALTGGHGVSFWRYLAVKVAQGLLAALTVFIYLIIKKPTLAALQAGLT